MKSGIYGSIAWILSLGVSYGFGWWSGARTATHVAAGAVKSGFPVLITLLAVAAVIAAVAAFKTRSYFGNDSRVARP